VQHFSDPESASMLRFAGYRSHRKVCSHRPLGQFTKVRAERDGTKVPLPETRSSRTLLACVRAEPHWILDMSSRRRAQRVERSRLSSTS
jgi:hypothetical protein